MPTSEIMRPLLALYLVAACHGSDKPAPGSDKPTPPPPPPADAEPDARVIAPKTARAPLACPAGATQVVGSRDSGLTRVRTTTIECRASADGAQDGPFAYYDDDGNLEQEGTYAHNKLDGSFTEYRNGVKYQTGTYDHGTMTGTWTTFYPDGKRASISERANDQTQEMTSYSASGHVIARGKSPNGKNEGLWEWFDDDGKPQSAELYKNGDGTAFWIWKQGRKMKVTEAEFDKAASEAPPHK